MRLLAQLELPACCSLGAVAGLAPGREHDDQHDTAAVLSARFGFPLTEGVRGFAEVVGQQLASVRHGGQVVTAGAGPGWPGKGAMPSCRTRPSAAA